MTLRTLILQKLLGFNRSAYWPMHFTSTVSGVSNIKIGIGTAPGLSPGCYIQGLGEIELGDYTLVGPGVGIISANHNPSALSNHFRGRVSIGRYCWLGMHSVILPGVTLGDHTVVGAGSIVTRSFPDGYCVIAGNPAREIRKLDPALVEEKTNPIEYVGFRRTNFHTVLDSQQDQTHAP